MHRLIIAGIGVLAVSLLAMGCGGGGEDEATAQISKAEFYKQARTICAKTEKKLLAELETSENDAAVQKLAQLREREAEELDALTGPEAVEEEVKPFIATIVKASRLVAQEGQVTGSDPTFKIYKHESDELGLRHC